jgi:hypothetical protein
LVPICRNLARAMAVRKMRLSSSLPQLSIHPERGIPPLRVFLIASTMVARRPVRNRQDATRVALAT